MWWYNDAVLICADGSNTLLAGYADSKNSNDIAVAGSDDASAMIIIYMYQIICVIGTVMIHNGNHVSTVRTCVIFNRFLVHFERNVIIMNDDI